MSKFDDIFKSPKGWATAGGPTPGQPSKAKVAIRSLGKVRAPGLGKKLKAKINSAPKGWGAVPGGASHDGKSMQSNQEEHQMENVESFEDIFKSESHTCESCGQDIQKGGKKKGKRGVAKEIGNEMDPHKGGKTGSFVKQPRTGSLGSAVDRNHSSKPRKPASGIVKGEEATVSKAMFPMQSSVHLVSYTGLGQGQSEPIDGDRSVAPNLELMNESGHTDVE